MSESEPKSPCISVCVLNAEDVCLGCYRSAEEITDWFMASAEDKRAIIERARQRMLKDKPVRLS
ncbi:DUF1289 domain-containing protein [Parahaliea sp. F7430]|uniref:DUF1289 domain-containing protein n=1 Tax=Sediminihaliea albiluteola TaxID=2758564 RepID=A0A7W2TXR0_9GAMM|nr:DUF1289 domain-containing protein [Sediminihaliea albiluteola]MBA6413744.1 DUF1289 domain-containing protein [Sediminihaliea albiluteola]